MARVPCVRLCSVPLLLAVACRSDASTALRACRSGPIAAGCPTPAPQAFVDPLQHLGRAQGDSFIEILDVVVDFPTVYACTGTQGLTVWDASNDDAPRQLAENIGPAGVAHARFPRCQHVGLDRANQRLIITNRGDEVQRQPFLWMYDVSDPGRPQALRGWVASESIEGVVLDGDRVFVAAHRDGVVALRDEGNTNFTLTGGFADGISDAWQPILLDTNTLVVAEAASGLRVYDVSTDDPQLMSTTPLSGASRDLALEGNLAYVATSDSLAVVDLFDPIQPVIRSQTPTLGTSLAVALGPDQTAVLAEWDEIRGYDVSNPDDPFEVFAETVPTDDDFSRVLALDVSAAERRVYAGEWTGMHVFEQGPDHTGPDIWATPKTVQFGNVGKGDQKDQVFVIRNRGDLPLTVHDVVTPNSVASQDTCFQVPARGASALEISYRPGGARPLSSALKLCSDDLDEPELLVALSANTPGLGVGDPVPSFLLRDLDGVEWTDEQLRGNVAVLAYFATF